MGIRIHRLRKQFETFPALDNIDLEVRQGELLALLGPSGSGKTTLLRIMAGLEHADGGQVLFGDEDATRMSVQSRRVGFVFQHYALFKHMDVFENIAFGLRVRRGNARWAEARIRARVEELLALVQLQGLEQRYPTQLSGGQRQRVALARALAIEPRVLLLDEPFGALDAQVRRDLRRWLRQLHERTGLTTVFVTHDQEEALELADRVAILNRGRIEQLDTPAMIYDKPASPFVYSFVGAVNRIPGCWRRGRSRWLGTHCPWPTPRWLQGRSRCMCGRRIWCPTRPAGRPRWRGRSAAAHACVCAQHWSRRAMKWKWNCRPLPAAFSQGSKCAWQQGSTGYFPRKRAPAGVGSAGMDVRGVGFAFAATSLQFPIPASEHQDSAQAVDDINT